MEQQSINKLEYLNDLFLTFGDYNLFCISDYDNINKKPIKFWKAWKKYSECNQQELIEANLRSVLKSEIILDIENPENYKPIVDELKNINVTFIAFSTGSRGYHIHLIFDELNKMENTIVETVKDNIIKYFSCDISKKSERNLIALEYEKHFKTGNKKEMVDKANKGLNCLNSFLVCTVKLKDVLDNDPKLNDLYKNGAWEKWGYPSRSEAEMSVCTLLVKNGFANKEIYSIMDNCKIGKWQEKPDSYKNMTISKAIEIINNMPKQQDNNFEAEQLFKKFEDLGIPKEIEWLVPNYIPYGVTVLTGKSGGGKSMIIQELMSAIANERKWFNQFEINNSDNRPILLIDMENSHSIIYSRLQKMGRVPKDKLYVFNLDANFDMGNIGLVNALFNIIDKINPCLIVFDTFRRTYSGDENDSAVINDLNNRVLKPISLTRSLILISHLRKAFKGGIGSNDNENDEIRGSGDIQGLSTAILKIVPNTDETYTIKQTKIRCEKLAPPFTLAINEKDGLFTYSISNSKEILTESDKVREELLNWLIHDCQKDELINSSKMKENMQNLGHSRSNIFNAIKSLENKGIIEKVGYGKFKLLFGNEKLTEF